jgi:hypothetical protein
VWLGTQSGRIRPLQIIHKINKSFTVLQGLYQMLEENVTVQCRKEDVEIVQVCMISSYLL